MLNENLQTEYVPEQQTSGTIKTIVTSNTDSNTQPPTYNEVISDHLPSYKTWSKRQQSIE
jgi:hypothetical protein